MRKKLSFALPTARPYGGYKRGRLPSFAPGTPPLSPNPPNHCRALSFPPTTLQIRDRSGLARLFANPRPAFPSATFANPRPAHLHPPHPQSFWKTRDSSHDLCYDNPHAQPRCQITAPFPGQARAREDAHLKDLSRKAGRALPVLRQPENRHQRPPPSGRARGVRSPVYRNLYSAFRGRSFIARLWLRHPHSRLQP
jgi:hypothetical protein